MNLNQVAKRLQMQSLMQDYPEVKWDRFTESDSHCTMFGWLDRTDGQRDFMVIVLEGDTAWYVTSSAKHSKEFSERSGDGDHKPCQLVEDFFPNVRTLRPSKLALHRL